MQTQLVTSLDALYHRVVVNPEIVHKHRKSIVLFIPLANTLWWDKQGKGRLQDFKPGFFYSMPQEELQKYFS